MPVLRREEERRQQTRLGLAAGGTTATIAAVAALSVWAINSRNNALDAISRSLFATDRVIQSVAGSDGAGRNAKQPDGDDMRPAGLAGRKRRAGRPH